MFTLNGLLLIINILLWAAAVYLKARTDILQDQIYHIIAYLKEERENER